MHRGAERGRQEFHKTLIADRVWEFTVQVPTYIRYIIGFEVTEAHLVKIDHNGHQFTHR